jgi:hypothetical protein
MLILRNAEGYRIGQSHHRAILSDLQVVQIREKYKAAKKSKGPRKGYGWLAHVYGVGESTIRDIVKRRTRDCV